jgi:hypothetical protein
MDVTAAGDAFTRVRLDWKRSGRRERRALVLDPFPASTTYDASSQATLPTVVYTFAEAEVTLPLTVWIVPEFDILVINATEQLEVAILPDPSPGWDGAARRPADSSESRITIGDILESLRNGSDPRGLS